VHQTIIGESGQPVGRVQEARDHVAYRRHRQRCPCADDDQRKRHSNDDSNDTATHAARSSESAPSPLPYPICRAPGLDGKLGCCLFDTTGKLLHDLQKREVKPSAQKYFIFPKGRNYDLKNSARLDTGT
jgi:hypothetical protein